MKRATHGLPMGKQGYQFSALEPKHVEQAAGILTRSFLALNKVWKFYNPSQPSLHSFFRDIINLALKAEQNFKAKLGENAFINFVYLKNGVVIAAIIMYELSYFLSKPYEDSQLSAFNKMELAGKEMQKSLDLKRYEGNLCLYPIFGAVESSYIRQGVAEDCWIQIFSHVNTFGVKYMVSRISSQFSWNLWRKFGATSVAQFILEEDGKQLELRLADLELKTAIDNIRSGLKKSTSKEKNHPTPKL